MGKKNSGRDNATLAQSHRSRDGWIIAINFLIAIIGLLTALIALFQVIEERRDRQRSAAEIRTRVGALEECQWVQMSVPAPTETRVRGQFLKVMGTADTGDGCRFVYVFLRKNTPTGQPYYVSEQIQVEENGDWRGTIDLDHAKVDIDIEFQIQARLTRSRESYRPLNWLQGAPEIGVSSAKLDLVREN